MSEIHGSYWIESDPEGCFEHARELLGKKPQDDTKIVKIPDFAQNPKAAYILIGLGKDSSAEPTRQVTIFGTAALRASGSIAQSALVVAEPFGCDEWEVLLKEVVREARASEAPLVTLEHIYVPDSPDYYRAVLQGVGFVCLNSSASLKINPQERRGA